MRDVYVIGVHTIKFGKYIEKTIKDLTAQTVQGCLQDASLDKRHIQAIWFANSAWGYAKGQECIRGQVALRPLGIDAIPITNIENACAGGSTAFHHAWLGVASGLYDITMAIGVEKLYDSNKYMVFAGFLTGLDIENINTIVANIATYGLSTEDKENLKQHIAIFKNHSTPSKNKFKSIPERLKDYENLLRVYIRLTDYLGKDTVKQLRKLFSIDHSPFMDVYGFAARQHMKKYGSTIEQLAHIASKNHFHSSLNPNAQYNFTISVDEVLADRIVSWPLTRSMCAPIGDGAASAILCDEKTAKKLGVFTRAVKIRASVLGSGKDRLPYDMDIAERLSKKAYEIAGISPTDINCAEVHDATAFGELHQTEALGFCNKGEGGIIAMRGETKIGGRIPINTSGGLESRGHPVAASGLAQIHEVVTQLRHEAGQRQVPNAKLALTENGGGALGQEEAAMCIHIFEAPYSKK
ncbi:MAG TPA: thiolase family protein [Spirochaetota bacterium]|nr:thiolase family protein [Spirochaetota bacterium]HOM09004.1 thiolase family protein [Spirochaetota bacterium]HPP48866.1 thiolase family protein [Spirochaetota bacterium]